MFEVNDIVCASIHDRQGKIINIIDNFLHILWENRIYHVEYPIERLIDYKIGHYCKYNIKNYLK